MFQDGVCVLFGLWFTVIKLSKQQNRTRTTPSTALRTTPQTILGRRDSPWMGSEAHNFSVEFPSGSPPRTGTFTIWNRTRNRTRHSLTFYKTLLKFLLRSVLWRDPLGCAPWSYGSAYHSGRDGYENISLEPPICTCDN